MSDPKPPTNEATPRVTIWERINDYAITCGGDPSKLIYGNTARQKAVVEVEATLNIITADLAQRLAEAEKARDAAKFQLTNENSNKTRWMRVAGERSETITAMSKELSAAIATVEQLRAERDDLAEFKREVDAEGTVPASRVQLLENTENELAQLREELARVRAIIEAKHEYRWRGGSNGPEQYHSETCWVCAALKQPARGQL